MSQSCEISIVVTAIETLIRSVQELNLAQEDLRQLEESKRYMKDCQGNKRLIDYRITNEHGDKIGVVQNKDGKVEFVTEKDTATVKQTLNKVTQAYSRIKILDEVKKKGYKSVKEEKLPNGSIRIVVEKWR
jgi:hypothetical protein